MAPAEEIVGLTILTVAWTLTLWYGGTGWDMIPTLVLSYPMACCVRRWIEGKTNFPPE